MRFSGCPNRKRLGEQFARGSGIEIAPLNAAWPVPNAAQVKYIDRYTREELVKQYPEIPAFQIADTDVIDDARTLRGVEDNSQDFILNSHVFEHCDNPLKTLERWLEVLKPGGNIICAIPDKDFTFDHDRPLSEIGEIVLAYHGSDVFKRKALDSFYRYVDKFTGEALDKAIENAMQNDTHVHFPVWTVVSFVDFLKTAQTIVRVPFSVELLEGNGFEFYCVLSKGPQ